MTAPLVPYRHPATGFHIPLPEDWERAEDARGVALIAVEPDRGPWFRANAVVTIDRLTAPADLASWQDGSLALMREALAEFRLLDVEDTEIAGQPARRTLAHHRVETELTVNAVTLEQWALVVGHLGYTVSTSAASLEYHDLADRFAEMAHQFRPDPDGVPG